MRRLAFSLIWFVGCLSAGDVEEISSTFSNLPNWSVAGCVSPISGCYFISENDVVVRGAQPLPVPRKYLSHDEYGRGGWGDHNHLYLQARSLENDCFYISTYDSSGMPLIFGDKVPSRKIVMQLPLNPSAYGGALLNTALGPIGGRTNLRNAYARYEDGNCLVFLPDGTVRRYSKKIRKQKTKIKINDKTCQLFIYKYFLEEEALPNGNKILYRWSSDQKCPDLVAIATTGPQPSSVYATAKYDYEIISTSDGREILGEFTPKHDQLKSLQITGLPKELLTYQKNQLIKRAYGKGPFKKITYNEKKTEKYSDEWKIKGGKHKEWGIREVWPSRAVNSISDGIGTYSISYNSVRRKGISKITSVVDPEEGKTVFEVDRKSAPKSVTYFDPDGKQTRKIEYQWVQGNLTKTQFINEKGETYKSVDYEYDDHHNIAKETISGPSEEDVITEFRYNRANLPIWKKEPDGKITRTAYWEKTNLPREIFIYDSEKSFYRTKYKYNNDNVLIEKVEDDGMLCRKIRRIRPHRSGEKSTEASPIPALNLPEEIADYYYDFTEKKEVLLKRVKNRFDEHSRLVEEQIYDENNIYCYTRHYSYDDDDHLTAKTDALGQVIEYSYDNQNNCIKETHKYKNLEIQRKFDQRNCLISEKSIDLSDQRCLEAHHNKYDKKKRKILETDQLGNQTAYLYNSDDHIIEKHLSDGTIWKYEYDAAGNCIKVIDGNKNITTYTYDIFGRKRQIQHPNKTKETYTYNPDGTLQSYTDQENLITKYTYNLHGQKTEEKLIANGEILFEEKRHYEGSKLRQKKQSGGRVYRYSYDLANRLVSERYEYKHISYEYDSLGRRNRIIEGEREKQIRYDNLDRVIEEQDKGTNRKKYQYDGHGNRKTITQWIDGKESTTQYKYDGKSRLQQKIDPLGHETHIHYDSKDKNLQKTIQYPDGTKKTEERNDLDQTIQNEWKDQNNLTIHREQYHYDPTGNLLQVLTTYTLPNGDEKTFAVEYQYDALNRKIQTKESGSKTHRYEYTPAGLEKCITKPDGTKIHKTYDKKKRLERLHSSDGTIDYRYTYDDRDRLINVTAHGSPCIKREYDNQDRIIQEKFLGAYAVKKIFDIYGRALIISYPDKKNAYYFYDPYRLKKIQFETHAHKYTEYDTSGCLLEETLMGDIGTQTHTYDQLGRENSRISPYHEESYDEFSSQGNLLRRTHNTKPYTYAYDSRNQLIKEEGATTTEYNYDTLFNRREKNDLPYQINHLNQLTETADTTYTYDANGNPIEKKTDNQITKYTYDALDRLTAVQTGTTKHTYTYDPFHRRLTANLDHFIYDGKNEIGKITSGKITERRLLGQGLGNEIGATIYTEIKDAPYIPLHSIDGNIISLLDLQGNLLENQQYNAFGERTQPTNFPWGYQSKRVDPTGLVYFGSRYYDPAIGRFLTTDPAGYTDSYNTYAYLLNRPFVLVDPDGQEAVTASLIIAGAGAGSVAVTGGAALIIGYIAWEVGNSVNNWIEKQQEERFCRQAAQASKNGYRDGSNFSGWEKIDASLKDRKKGGSGDGSGGDDGDDGDKKIERSKRHTPDQRAMNELSKEYKDRGISNKEADILLHWAQECNFPYRDDRGVRPIHWAGGEHIHLGRDHVKVNE